MNTHQAHHARSVHGSQFFQRLKHLASKSDSTSLSNLVSATKRLLESAEAISKQVVRYLPQFTLHDDVHLWNVLSFMEELAGGQEGIRQLGAGDCAMAIWAAFIHDLGMVPEAKELAGLDAADQYDSSIVADRNPPDAKAAAWRAYRDGHHHWSAIRKKPDDPANRMRLGIIRAAFIRDSHAQDDAHSGQCRITDWLKFLSEGDRLIAQAVDDYAIAAGVVPASRSATTKISTGFPDSSKTLACPSLTAKHSRNSAPFIGRGLAGCYGWRMCLTATSRARRRSYLTTPVSRTPAAKTSGRNIWRFEKYHNGKRHRTTKRCCIQATCVLHQLWKKPSTKSSAG